MDAAIVYTFVSVLGVSVISLVGIVTLSFREQFLKKCTFILLSLAVGALFGDALIHLLPEAIEKSGNPPFVALAALLGIFGFFILEKFFHWHHHGHHGDEHHIETLLEGEEKKRINPLGYLILTSDAVHNTIDGLIIGASYLISIEVGIATTTAVILHEIPQEIADFGVLIHAGFSKARALLFNFGSALFAVLGAIIAINLQNVGEMAIPFLSAFAAGHFIYIAGTDLVPELHKTTDIKRSLFQLATILLGVSIMFALLALD